MTDLLNKIVPLKEEKDRFRLEEIEFRKKILTNTLKDLEKYTKEQNEVYKQINELEYFIPKNKLK